MKYDNVLFPDQEILNLNFNLKVKTRKNFSIQDYISIIHFNILKNEDLFPLEQIVLANIMVSISLFIEKNGLDEGVLLLEKCIWILENRNYSNIDNHFEVKK